MQVGDIVKHKNLPDRLRIRTMDHIPVCTCEFIDEPKVYYAARGEDFRICITRIENLSPYQEEQKQQLNLFK